MLIPILSMLHVFSCLAMVVHCTFEHAKNSIVSFCSAVLRNTSPGQVVWSNVRKQMQMHRKIAKHPTACVPSAAKQQKTCCPVLQTCATVHTPQSGDTLHAASNTEVH
jgi:hypothetical protein